MIARHSSRRERLDKSFLIPLLERAVRYRRIAGYFTSSLFEVAGEHIKNIPDVQIVCNSDIRSEDLRVSGVIEQRMLGRINEKSVEVDALMGHERYAMLADFLEQRGQVVRVAADDVCGFVHGKAGIIDLDDGSKVAFIGSMNESRNGWQEHYEILWSDDSEEGVRWVEEEFEFLWNNAKALPDAVVNEIKRRSKRKEVSVDDIEDTDGLAPAALIESPLYKEGFALRPWQQGFVGEVIKHYEHYKDANGVGVVRLLIADEVGLGKTLSMAVSAIVLCLIAEREGRARKPIIIFAPSTLCQQWQVELLDKLGVLCARWHTSRKTWVDDQGNSLSPEGAQHIRSCPLRIGIVSTGLMMQDSDEKHALTGLNKNSIELFILDESHKARETEGIGKKAGEPNNLLKFAREMSAISRHVIIGTATPIQTKNENLWEQMSILWSGENGEIVFGSHRSPWRDAQRVMPLLTGAESISDDEEVAWQIIKHHVPHGRFVNDTDISPLYVAIHQEHTPKKSNPFDFSRISLHELDDDTKDILKESIESEHSGLTFFQRENPFVHHVVLRRRKILEDRGLLPKIPVDLHPVARLSTDTDTYHKLFEGLGVRVSEDFIDAYEQAGVYGASIKSRGGRGFIVNMMRQRVSSSIHAGLCTANRILNGESLELEEHDDEGVEFEPGSHLPMEEREALKNMIMYLESVSTDPKLTVIKHYLGKETLNIHGERKTWLEAGCILFSMYYDTAFWMAERIAEMYPNEPVGLYAGSGKSKLFRHGKVASVDREDLKSMVKERQLRVMFATDAACEGLNLQTLGTLINIDLPWNPIKIEQRIGRIQRFGQTRDKVDMLNLVNAGTVDERVYERISERMQDRHSLFGGLPDTIKADWIEDIENLDRHMEQFIEAQKKANGFDLRYNESLEPSSKTWSLCSDVLSRRDLKDIMQGKWQ
jgi:hypothetical protein